MVKAKKNRAKGKKTNTSKEDMNVNEPTSLNINDKSNKNNNSTSKASWNDMNKSCLAALESIIQWANIEQHKDFPSTRIGDKRICLVLDPTLSSFVSRIITMSKLRELGIIDIFELCATTTLCTQCSSILYIVQSHNEMMSQIAYQTLRLEQYNNVVASNVAPIFIACVPALHLACEQQLEHLGIHSRVYTRNFPELALLALNADMGSMQQPELFKDAFLHEGYEMVSRVTNVLDSIQKVYGYFGCVMGKGRVSKMICKQLCQQDSEREPQNASSIADPVKRFSRVLIIDRTLDLITPIMTQLTYEGVIDELIGINHGYVDVVKECNDEDSEGDIGSNSTMRLPLSDSDRFFTSIRDKHFEYALENFKTIASEVKIKLESEDDMTSNHTFQSLMKNIPNFQDEHRALNIHFHLSTMLTRLTTTHDFISRLRNERSLVQQSDQSKIIESIQYCMVRQEPLQFPLRLLCLWSLLQNGIGKTNYDKIATQLIQAYGAAIILPLLARLKQVGLFHEGGKGFSGQNFKNICKEFNLIVEGNESKFDNDVDAIEHVSSYTGYTSLLVRIIQRRLLCHDWSNIDPYCSSDEPSFTNNRVGNNYNSHDNGATLVFVVGGITRAEICAIRCLKNKPQLSNIIIASSMIVTGSSLIKSLELRAPNMQQN